MSKRAVQYFTKAFAREIDKAVNLKIGLIMPGMVLTEMLLDPIRQKSDNSQQLKRLYNLLAEEVETVAPMLADKMISNEKNGALISFSSPLQMFFRVTGRLLSCHDIVSDKLVQ